MAKLNDGGISGRAGNIEIINPVGKRRICVGIHDIDGTHSLIRDWPPVMSLSINYAMTCGLDDDFDSDDKLPELVSMVGKNHYEETDQFCVESAGLSALTQMEYGIRRAIEFGRIPESAGILLDKELNRKNTEIIARIWNGEERFDEIEEPEKIKSFISIYATRLFVLYEKILNGACRDRNLADARNYPAKWRVPGSMEFMEHLYGLGIKNYFVTGAVIHENGGMAEEVRAVGFDIGAGKLVEDIKGSLWDQKITKTEAINRLLDSLGVNPENVLVVGDGRSEIQAGVGLGAVTMSRLPADATRQRELHISLGVNYIVPDYNSPLLKKIFS